MVHVLRRMCAALCAACAVSAAAGQDYPVRPIRIYVPLTPGSGADVASRVLARYLSEALRQPVDVDNRPGASGQVGAQEVLNAPPDGYTLLVRSGTHVVNAVVYRNLPYDTLKDFADIALLGITPYVMVTERDGRYRSLASLVDAARAKPGVIAYASSGVGTSTHLVSEYFSQMAGIRMLNVPYKGSPEAIKDVAAGRAAFFLAPANTAVGAIRQGRVAALGVTTRARAGALPEVPTFAEQGHPKIDISLWYGMWGPANMPPKVVRKLNAQVNAIMRREDVRRQFEELGITPAPMSPEAFTRFVRAEFANYRRIVEKARIQPQ